MQKSSVYLPEQLKHDLSALAARSGRAEADLIRRAIERLLAIEGVGEQGEPIESFPTRPRRQGPLLIGVGLGPGDPGHVTQAAKETLMDADRVFAISWSSHSVGRAETLARTVAPLAKIERLTHDIVADDSGRQRSLVAAADVIVASLDAAEVVAVVTLGDPSMWSILPSLAAEVRGQRPTLPLEIVPGITSYQALAAARAITLTSTGQRLVVVDGEAPDALLDDPLNTLVIYKGAPDVTPLRDQVSASGRLESTVIGELIGVPGERITMLAEIADGPVSYLAAVIMPALEADL